MGEELCMGGLGQISDGFEGRRSRDNLEGDREIEFRGGHTNTVR